MRIVTFGALLLFALLPRTTLGKDIAKGRALSGDIRHLGHRYYPLANVMYYTDGSVDYSCVVLIPWDERPKTTVSVSDGISEIKLGKQWFRIAGHYVAISDGKGLKLLPGELPASAYVDVKHFEAAILEVLKNADKKLQ